MTQVKIVYALRFYVKRLYPLNADARGGKIASNKLSTVVNAPVVRITSERYPITFN